LETGQCLERGCVYDGGGEVEGGEGIEGYLEAGGGAPSEELAVEGFGECALGVGGGWWSDFGCGGGALDEPTLLSFDSGEVVTISNVGG